MGLIHGHSKVGATTKTYTAWANMLQRCTNKHNDGYKNYGGRGINVCAEWFDFKVFLADMGEKPINLTLERKNNSLGYSKDNCIWATRKEQAKNKRAQKKPRTNTSGLIGVSIKKRRTGTLKAYVAWARIKGVTLDLY